MIPKIFKKNNRKTCFAVIDPGSYEISAVAAEWGPNGEYCIHGTARGDSRNIRKGIVTDARVATESVAEVLSRLAERSGCRIREVYSGVSSPSIKLIPSHGMVLLSKYGREVTEKDVRDSVRIASALRLPLDTETIHRVVKGFSIDGEFGIKNPLDLDGVKLGADVNVVTINSSALRNLAKCISEAGYIPGGFILSAHALSRRMLRPEDRQCGVVLLDVCDRITTALYYKEDILSGCKAVPNGLDEVMLPDGTIDEARLLSIAGCVRTVPDWDKATRMIVTGDGAMNES
ncbi:MAG: hypothetical protein PHT95_05520, partial [Candidatus Omnitrophica bacterium]|nr:hypothetical protein [Candidatus Omnitrophota bacterium]